MRHLVAQSRLVATAAVVSRFAPARWTANAVTREPRLEDTEVVGVPCLLARPATGARWPAIVFVNGVTARGRDHPAVVRLAYALGRTGHVVLVPDPPGLAVGEVGDDTVAGVTSVATEVADRDDNRHGRVALLGVSVGASLALLAAQDERLADRVSVVAGIAPYTDLSRIVHLATTGQYPAAGGAVAFPTPPFLLLVVARSLVLGLPAAPDGARLRAILAAVEIEDPDPLAGLRAIPQDAVEPATRALIDLLLNTDPARFPALYDALPEAVRDGTARLSPIVHGRRLRAPVEIAAAPTDKYFPLAETEALADVAADVRITVTGTLAHAIPDLSFATVAELLRLDGFGVRVLEKARR
jgi:alpha-beta hydrolase superfamily lysophospholipase